ncbi:hypothetical protein [Halobellus sp. H-GB7]|uniref:hypothetical protein n=1 Tax=Halobellus sp. H-GB7 TaxID=3069756 RepID=UPI0027B3DEF4|nr:hypothetical protein [Halobellus sp. H-GB7]MDQ2054486.1 hypothetical protein [Halobellus sp. H-GB7]
MPANSGEYRFDVDSLRDPSDLMQPERLGSLKQTRLSFARLLMEKMTAEEWDITLDRADLDRDGVGRAVYTIETPSQLLSFGVFSHNSGEGENTDRIIANDWDLWAFLCEGEITDDLMDDQFEELPHVREGRATPEILIWTRANRSRRFFGHIVDSLAAGHQPDIDFLSTGGYLMRSSGYYGNGLNGTKEFRAMDGDHPLKGPYMAQMLAVYMLRVFGYDLAERMAEARDSDAATLDYDIKRYLGTGNSSGVGIIHYVVNHPQLMHAWLRAREVALARAKSVKPSPEDVERFRAVLDKATTWFAEDDSDTEEFFVSKDRIARELQEIADRVETVRTEEMGASFWTDLCDWAERHLEKETQEVLHSLLLDVYPETCEGLVSSLTASERSDVAPEMSLGELQSLLTSEYQWALDIDMSDPDARRFFWYRSIEEEEPRIGVRGEQDYEEYGLPIGIANQVQQLEDDLDEYGATQTVAEFLFEHPEHRDVVERVQTVHGLSYAEVRANPLDADFVPLSFISSLKAIWGVQKKHPKSKGWVKGTFFQGAPLAEDLTDGPESYWLYPSKPDRAAHWRAD